MSAFEQYWRVIGEQLAAIQRDEKSRLETAAEWVAEALLKERFVYVFGSGHSHTVGEEAFYRAGGLVRAVAIFDENLMVHKSAIASTEWERKEGYAAQVLARYPITAGDVLLIITSSGRNAVPVEMAMEGKKRGAKVIGLTSVQYSSSMSSRHSSGKKLMDVADLVIDNHSIAGDATVEIENFTTKAAPTSTVTCAFIWNSIVARSVELAVKRGGKPEVWTSANSKGENLNDGYVDRYRGKVPHL